MKTTETVQLEDALRKKYCTAFEYGCHEVTIGIGGSERVDFMTISSQGIIRCFEIKISRADLYSNASLSFRGHLNYLVVPKSLQDEALNFSCHKTTGILAGQMLDVVRKPRKQALDPETLSLLKISLIRSMARELRKSDPNEYNILTRRLASAERTIAEKRQSLRTARLRSAVLKGYSEADKE